MSDTLTVSALRMASDGIATKASNRGFYRCECRAHVPGWRGTDLTIRVQIAATNSSYSEHSKYFHQAEFDCDETVAQTIARASAWVDEQDTPDDIERKSIHEDLGRLIDRSNALGLEVGFVNPLETAMKKLSENVLTDQRAAAE